MSSFWGSLFGRGPSPQNQQQAPAEPYVPVPAPDPEEPLPTPQEMADSLTWLVRKVNRAGGRMPEGGVPAVREVEDVLRPLLEYLQQQPATEAEMIGVRAMVTDYLPTTVDTFLALPAQFAQTHRNRSGRSPEEEFLQQLELLAEGAGETATAIYAGDAQLLTNQGRFLQNRFARSELDL